MMARLSQLLLEDDLDLASDLNRMNHSDPNVSAYAHLSRDGTIHLADLQVKRTAPPGTGTAFMDRLCALADKNGAIITLTPGTRDPSGHAAQKSPFKRTTSTTRLDRFYRRFGFVRNSSKGRYDLYGTRHRSPRTPPASQTDQGTGPEMRPRRLPTQM